MRGQFCRVHGCVGKVNFREVGMVAEELLYVCDGFAREQRFVKVFGDEFDMDGAGIGFPALVGFA